MITPQRRLSLGAILDWLQFGFAFLAGIALILDNYEILSLPVIRSNLDKFTFLFICGLVVSTFLERRYKLQGIEEAILDKHGLGQRMRFVGVEQIYEDRRDLPSLDQYFDRASGDILIVGITLYGLITNNRDLFERKIAAGCSFRFLLPAALPEENSIDHLANEAAIHNTRYDLDRTFKEVVGLIEKTKTSRGKPKVELRVFDFIPTMGVMMLDGNKHSGSIRVELYPYRSRIDKRPALELRKGQKPDCLYNYIRARYEQLWMDAQKYKES